MFRAWPRAITGGCLPLQRHGTGHRAMAASADGGRQAPGAWASLPVSLEELCLGHTLPVGQTFRWVETREGAFTGEPLTTNEYTDLSPDPIR